MYKTFISYKPLCNNPDFIKLSIPNSCIKLQKTVFKLITHAHAMELLLSIYYACVTYKFKINHNLLNMAFGSILWEIIKYDFI